MELLYIWIKDYKNIKKQGFQFGGEYTIDYNENEGTLIFTQNSQYIQDFFITEKWKNNDGFIYNVTAIIGENGSGKSNLIEFFCENLRMYESFKLIRKIIDDIIVFQYQKTLFVYHDEKLKKFNLYNKESPIRIRLNQPDENFQYNNKNKFTHFLVPIYFSTNLTDRITLLFNNEWELLNVSNSYFYYVGHFPLLYTDFIRKNTYKIIDYPGRHLSEDVKRQLFFIKENRDWLIKEFGLKPLEYVYFGIIQTYMKSDNFKKLFELLFSYLKPSNDAEFSKTLFFTSSLLSYVFPNNSKAQKNYFNILKAELNQNSKIISAILNFLNKHPFAKIKPENIKSPLNGKVLKLKMNDFKIPETIDFLKFVDKHFHIKNFFIKNQERSLYEDYNKNEAFNQISICFNVKLTYEFLDQYLYHLGELTTPDYLYFDSLNYSAGEIAFLNLFSRFQFIQQQTINDFDRFRWVRWVDENNTVTIFIDEGETYFHPQWQKKYFNNLLNFLPKIFKGKNIQLILTSNSPLLLSDLPKQNIIFLKREKKSGLCKVSELKEQKDTFASNIHTLLSDSFFIQDGLIGDFARTKINKIIKILNEKLENINESEIEEIRIITELIGEPIIKNRLIKMIEDKIGSNIISVDKRIRFLEEELKKLKGGKK